MPGYFASNALPTFSASGRSTEVYQTTLPSFFAASISAGVTRFRRGRLRAHARGECGAAERAAPFRMSRRDSLRSTSLPPLFLVSS
jgi:hypothetical protein